MIDDFHVHKGLTNMRARACLPATAAISGKLLPEVESLRTVVCLINRKFIWRSCAKRAVEKTGVRIFQTNVLRWGESAFYAFGMNEYTYVREASADARKSRQICSHGDSQDVTN